MDITLRAYIECALWASVDDSADADDSCLGGAETIDDLAPETLAEMASDVAQFIGDASIQAAIGDNATWSQVGHDLWLTRNGHGAGFWDRDCYVDRDALTTAAKAMGSRTLYVGDDGLIYQCGG